MKKLIVILFLLVALSGLGAISGGTARPDRTVTIPAGGGSITNIVWQSNTRYVLDTGTNTVSTFVGTTADIGLPHLIMAFKTNIVIMGLGPQSVVFTGQTGTVFCITNCDNITFQDFTILGTRGPESGFNFGGQMAAIEERGNNTNLRYQRVRFINHSDQGISGDLNSSISYTSNSIITDCYFENIGCTNGNFGFGLGRDGTAVVMNGDNITVEKCRFIKCMRDQEPFSFNGPDQTSLTGLKIIGNTSFGCKEGSMYGQITINGLIYQGNSVVFDPAMLDGVYDNHRGIALAGCRNVQIIGNYFSFAEYGVAATTASGSAIIANCSMIGNTFYRNVRGAFVTSASGTNSGWVIENNTFSYQQSDALRLNGMNQMIRNNQFNRNGCLNGGPTIWCFAYGGATGSNTFAGNTFWSDNAFVTQSPSYCLQFDSGINNNIVQDNRFADFTTAPWLDSGAANRFFNNFVGTNLLPFLVSSNSYVTTFGGGTPGGTNVIWNVAANPVQAVVITNTCLVIATNFTALNSAQRSKLILISNQTTNCGVFVTAAGVRLAGVDSALTASATAAAHNSLTNGRAMIMECEYFGTNLVVEVKHTR